MTSKELSRLRRSELMELLLLQSKEADELREKISSLEEELKERNLKVDRTGSLAEAALQLAGVFEAAQDAADLYLKNVTGENRPDVDMEEKCRAMESAAHQRCAAMEQAAQERCDTMEQETRERCSAMLRETEEKSKAYWWEVEKKLDTYVNEHREIKSLLRRKGTDSGKTTTEKETKVNETTEEES